ASINSVLDEPIEDCLLAPDTLDVRSPLDIEASVGMPGGHIFHGDLQWPFAESEDEVGRWGTETRHANIFLCGSGARRGGAVSGIPGRAAVAAALGEDALGRGPALRDVEDGGHVDGLLPAVLEELVEAGRQFEV